MKLQRFTYLLLSFVAFAILTAGSCGGGKGNMKAANEAFDKKEYFVALESYKSVYSTTKDKDEKKEACFKTAESFRMVNDTKNAEAWYKKAIKAGYKNPEAQFRYAESLKNNQKYAEAISEFKTYLKTHPNDERALKMIRGCEDALKWKNEKTRYIVENCKELNTKFSDFGPAYYKNTALYFASDREQGKSKNMYVWTGNMYCDIYSANLKKNKLSAPAILEGLINTKFNDATLCFDKKGTTMYYTQCNGINGDKNSCKIYTSSLKGKEWSEPVVLPFCSDSFSCGHPTLSDDGNILYFSSDMPGGKGGKDIYFVNWVKKSKTWSDPVNIGDKINTEGHEMFPFIHADGTLYFSSNGHIGLGGLDIFSSKGTGVEWSEPKNMKSPLNSGGDDFGFICDASKEFGYFSSNREGGRGQDDIWKFAMTPLKFTISGVARDSKTKEILPNTLITMTNSTDTVKRTAKTDRDGFYKFVDLKSNTDYELFAQKEDYYDSRLESQTTKGLEVSTDLIQDFLLDPFDYNAMIKVEGIYYDLDKADLRPRSREILDSLVLTLNKYPRIIIELGSHTDCRADSSYNVRLAQARADSAVNYVITKGVDPERLIARGYGESKLVNDCACEGQWEFRKCTEEEHQMNRRTTVRIISNKFIPKTKTEMKDLNAPKPATPPAGGTKPGTTPPPRK